MTHPATRRILLRLIGHGASPVVVFDVDELSLFVDEAGATAGADALAGLTSALEKAAVRSSGQVHFVEPDRFLVALPARTYDEAVAFAEQTVDTVRLLAIPFSAVRGARLSVTAAVVSVESRTDIERFDLRVNDLLRDGKATGGDAIIRDR